MGENQAKESVGDLVKRARDEALASVKKAADDVTRKEAQLVGAKQARKDAAKVASEILTTKEIAEALDVSTGAVSGWMREPDSKGEGEPEPEFPGEPDAATVPIDAAISGQADAEPAFAQ